MEQKAPKDKTKGKVKKKCKWKDKQSKEGVEKSNYIVKAYVKKQNKRESEKKM
jgi:hypothetical protein